MGFMLEGEPLFVYTLCILTNEVTEMDLRTLHYFVVVAEELNITRSLPTARLVWHCPFVSIFTSNDGTVDGEGYREYLLLRLDGETWKSDAHADNKIDISHKSNFPGWNTWKDVNKRGMDCMVTIRRDGNRVAAETENLGILINSLTTINDDVSDLYAALTGDQCALTNIRIISETENSVRSENLR